MPGGGLCFVAGLNQAQAQSWPKPTGPFAFYSMANTNWPPMPGPSCDCEVIYLGKVDDIATYLVDDRAWQAERDAQFAASRAMLSERLQDALHTTPRVYADPDDWGTEEDSPGSTMGPVYTTNDLWLEIIDFQLTNSTADLVLHPPSLAPEQPYDLYFRTNLNIDYALPFSFQWRRILRAEPGQTNLVVTNLPPAQGFFTIGPTNNAIRPGFDQQFLAPNDDNFGLTNLLANIGFGIDFFGTTYTTLYVNNNGNVTFDGPRYNYTPTNLATLGIKLIAPYWADVDTRNSASDVVRYGTNAINGHSAFGVEWVNVGYYTFFGGGADKLLSCQLVIIDRSDIATSDFDLEFNYDKVEWEWGQYPPTVPPRAGYADGVTNSYELPGSGVGGAFLDANLDTGLIYHSLEGPRTNLLSSPLSGRYRFFFRGGTPLP
jgi:hypothetical protein